MDSWKEYIQGIVIASLICSLVMQMISGSAKRDVMRIICGVLLSAIILQPFSRIRLEDFQKLKPYETDSAEHYLDLGKATADEMKSRYITDRYEAYILDKAESMGAEIIPIITIDESDIPVFAEIQGTIAPEIQDELERILIMEMGITKENQRWVGNTESSNCAVILPSTDT